MKYATMDYTINSHKSKEGKEHMKKIRNRSLTVLLTLVVMLALIMIPKDESKAANDQTITLLKDKIESSVDDVTYIHYLYTPKSDYTKVVSTITASNGQSSTASVYAYGDPDFYYFKITIYVAGTYTVDLVEYEKSGDDWVKTGYKAKATVTVSAKKTGWQKTNGEWCYYDSNGKRQYGWQKISGKWYYLDDFFGAITTGWFDADGKWYYFEASGAAATGWKVIDGKWYHFNGGAYMDTGWKQIDGKWYHFASTGEMATGWKKLSKKWYYFDKSGAMVTGWKQLSGKWYYFISSGTMATEWQKIDDKWYYFGSDGIMRTGWQEIEGNWYYFRTGVMCTGKVKIAGKTYTFDKNGVYQKK